MSKTARGVRDATEAHRRRIRELKKQLEEIAGGPVPMGFSEHCPLAVQERFLEHVVRYEQTAPVVLIDELSRQGMDLPEPDRLDDAQLHVKLWEVLQRLALLGAYLRNTNHLSDRELYGRLWYEVLRDPVVILPDEPDYDCFCDLAAGGRDEDVQLWLKYYADDEDRRRWSEAWPDDPLPERAAPPCDRDRHLPRPNGLGQPHPALV